MSDAQNSSKQTQPNPGLPAFEPTLPGTPLVPMHPWLINHDLKVKFHT